MYSDKSPRAYQGFHATVEKVLLSFNKGIWSKNYNIYWENYIIDSMCAEYLYELEWERWCHTLIQQQPGILLLKYSLVASREPNGHK